MCQVWRAVGLVMALSGMAGRVRSPCLRQERQNAFR